MADPVNEIAFIPNEFYELKDGVEIQDHPHEPLIPFKFVMVSWATVDSVCFTWPSIYNLAYFYKCDVDVLPRLDQNCILEQFDAARIVKRQLDLADFCLYRAWREYAWLHMHTHSREDLHDTMATIPFVETEYIKRIHVRADYFYSVSFDDFPQDIAVRPTGFARIAWVTGQTEGQNPTVEVRIPSMESLAEFERLESLPLPVFDQVFTISAESARRYLRKILPIELIMQQRRRRDLWINLTLERFHDLLLSMPCAGAGVDARDAAEGVSIVPDAGERVSGFPDAGERVSGFPDAGEIVLGVSGVHDAGEGVSGVSGVRDAD